MCGLTGFWQPQGIDVASSRALALAMARTISSRGPDGEGAWVDGAAGIALAHRRLAVVDLSAAGAQPMVSAGGRYVIVFNGEIYNHLELRARLPDRPVWRGHSDTETLLACFEAWGPVVTLRSAIGMFALALWDRHERALWLGRDRLGEKPLYFGWQGEGERRTLLFGSELKALGAHPEFAADIDREALTAYMRFGYVPAPKSIHRGIGKLEPGTLRRFEADDRDGVVHRYWSATQAMLQGFRSPLLLDDDEATDELERRLRTAVARQMVADVPLGAFLSGGIDSSTVVALMQAQSQRAVRTFSIGFDVEGYDEAAHAKAVARHLGTEHTELYVTPEQALDVVPRLPDMYDEPFADSSQIPTHLVAALARRDVTVALSGDGGDELFGGYNRYALTARLWRRLGALPRPLRFALAASIRGLPAPAWDRLFSGIDVMRGGRSGWSRPGEKMHKGAAVLTARSVDEVYRGMVSAWDRPETVVIGGRESASLLDQVLPELQALPPVERMMASDLLSYLPDDILAKVDRAAMAVSLETRVPLLDHEIVEFAWQLPLSLKLRDGQTKWALRQVLYRHVPRELLERPKMGFGVPIDHWLRGPLREWAETLLAPDSLRRDGLLDPEPIRRRWQEHLSGRGQHHPALWNVLMFQAWRAARPNEPRTPAQHVAGPSTTEAMTHAEADQS